MPNLFTIILLVMDQTSPSTPSIDAIQMYLMGVKEKGPVAPLPSTTLKSCFAQIGHAAKPRKTKTCLQVHKELRHWSEQTRA